MRASIIPIFIPHIGCPMNCVFCNQRRISGSLLPATPEDVQKQLQMGLEKLPEGRRPQVAFYGGSFTAIPAPEQEALLKAAHAFILSGRVESLRVSTRPDAIDDERLARLWRYGVRTVELGSQSMDDAVLRKSNRGHTARDTENAAARIRKWDFQLILQMMTGLPGSSFEKDLASARKIAALRPDGVRIYPTVIVKDTALYDMWRRGEYAAHTVPDAVSLCAEIVPIFEDAGIPVIRLGLNPTEELSGGSAAAGAYHPALGELVLSRMYLNRLRPELQKYRGAKSLLISVHPTRISVMVGQNRGNISAICSEFGIGNVKVVGNEVEKNDIRVVSVANR
ncbi:MAG: elongator complex protein 3 [Oscillospiraceae bacterium]